ncbi:hypothetical protein [Streptomyces sp. NRRL S-495]|nr:hypothetical protein [Streptomyces sp. NRRL S-495]
MRMQHITVTAADGTVTKTSTTDPDVAREFENLPFETDHVVSVQVTVDDE